MTGAGVPSSHRREREPLGRGGGPAPGFTLVETLLCLALVALLVAILAPALSQARQSARLTRWRGAAHALSMDPRLDFYWSFEDPGQGQIARNIAAGDPLREGRRDVEPRDADLILGNTPLPVFWDDPVWTPTAQGEQARWPGKGGLSFKGLAPGISQHAGTRFPTYVGGTDVTVFGAARFRAYQHAARLLDLGDGPEKDTLSVGNVDDTGAGRVLVADAPGTALASNDVLDAWPLDDWAPFAATVAMEGAHTAMRWYSQGAAKVTGDEIKLQVDARPPLKHRPQALVGRSLWTPADQFDGILDELGLAHEAFAPEEIAQHHAIGAARKRR